MSIARPISLALITLLAVVTQLTYPASSSTSSPVTVVLDSALGLNSVGVPGGEKIIQDSFGKMILVYVDSSSPARLGISWANADPTLASSWSTPIKSASPSSSYSKPAAVLVTPTSLRIIVQGGSGSGRISDVSVTIQRDTQNNITGATIGAPVTLDNSGFAQFPTATLAKNGDILAAWNFHDSSSSRVKTFRWKPGTGWRGFGGSSTVPDDAVVETSNLKDIFPSIIQRKDNGNVYVIGNEGPGGTTNLVYNKATFDGTNWSWGAAILNYETTAARGVEDATSVAWDPVRSQVVAAFDVSGTNHYGVFTLTSSDVKTHVDTPDLILSDNDWGFITVDSSGVYYLILIDASSDGATGRVAYTKSTNGASWNTTLTGIDTSTTNHALSVRKTGGSSTIDLVYANEATSPATVKFVRMNTTPPPLTADFTFSPSSPAPGQSVTFTGTASGGTGPYTFSWSFGETATATGNPVSHVYSAKGSYTVTLNVTDSNSASVSVSSIVAVVAQPLTIDFSVSPVSPVVGEAASFTGTATGGTGPYTFNWNFGDGSTGTGSSISHTYSLKGSFNVTVTLSDSNGASAGVRRIVTVSPQPLSAHSCPNTATAGQPLTCNGTATGGTSPYSFIWDVNGDGSVDGTSPTFTTVFSTKGTYVIRETAADSNGATATVDNTVIVQGEPMTAAIKVSPSSPAVGDTVTFNVDSTSGGTAPYAFTWTFGDGSQGTGSMANHSYATKGTYLVTLTVTDSNQATVTVTDAITVAAQQLTVSLITSTETPTAGNHVGLDAAASGGTGPYAYSWAFGDGSTANGSSVSHTYSTKGSYSITLTVTDFNGASAASSRAVTVSPQPLTADFTFNPSSPQVGGTVVFTSSSTGGTAPYSFSWDFGDGSTAAGVNVTHVYSTKGSRTIALNVTDSNGVSTVIGHFLTVNGQALMVDFNSSPEVPVVNSTTTFTATVTGGTAPYTIVWDFGDGANATGTPTTHTYLSPGNYTVRVVVTDVNQNSVVATVQKTVLPWEASAFELDWADYDNNGVINILDVAQVAICFDRTPNTQDWYTYNCAYWDLNLNGKVEILDIARVAFYFGRTMTTPFPGQAHDAGTMDPQWHSYCSFLNSIDKQYCQRLG